MKIHRFLSIVLVLFLVLGQFSRIPLGDSNVSIYLNDLFLPIIILFWFLNLLPRIKKYKFPYLSLPIFLFLVVGMISLFWNKQFLSLTEFLVSGLYLWRWGTYVGVYFVFRDFISCLKGQEQREKEIKFWVKLILGVGFGIAFLGLVQYFIFPDFSTMVAHGWDPHYYRVLSTFFDPNYVGGFLVLNLSLVLVLSLEVDSWKKLDLVKGLIGVILLVAIILTFSRSTYLCLVGAMGVLGLIRERKILILGILFSVLVFLLIPRVQERVLGGFVNIDDSASFRFQSWEKGLLIARKNPIIGVGYNSYRYAQLRYDLIQPWEEGEITSHASAGVDSSLLLILATTGLLGTLIYLWLWGRKLILSFKAYLSEDDKWARVLGLSMIAAIAGLILHSQFVNSLLYPFILEWVMIVFGLMEGISE